MPKEENLKVLREKNLGQIREIMARSRAVAGVCAIDLTTGDRLGVNENLIFPQASAIKIPVLMEIFRGAQAGRFQLSAPRRIARADQTPGSGILCELGDGTVEMCLRDLCILMIVLSDNTATNILIDLAGCDAVNGMLQQMGLHQTRLQRRMMDLSASIRGEENLSTPAEAARLMELLYRGEFGGRALCDDILTILKIPKEGKLIAGLPAGTCLASKPGAIAGVATEWAIVFLPERPYVVTIMENYGAEDAPALFKDLSSVLYEYHSRLGRATEHGALLVAPPSH